MNNSTSALKGVLNDQSEVKGNNQGLEFEKTVLLDDTMIVKDVDPTAQREAMKDKIEIGNARLPPKSEFLQK